MAAAPLLVAEGAGGEAPGLPAPDYGGPTVARTTTPMSAHINRLREINQNTEPRVIQALLEAGELVRQEAMRSIRENTIRGPGHIPSLPGEPPKGDSGRLETSIEVQLRRSEKTVNVIATAPYAAAQEFGTRNMAARPYLRPALRKYKNRLVTALAMTARGDVGVRVYRNSRASIEGADAITGRINPTP